MIQETLFPVSAKNQIFCSEKADPDGGSHGVSESEIVLACNYTGQILENLHGRGFIVAAYGQEEERN